MRTLTLLLLLFCSTVRAESSLTSVFPLSCQTGQEVEVKLAGKEIGDVTDLIFSTPDISAKATGAGKFLVRVRKDARPQVCDVWCIAHGRLSGPPRRFVVSRHPSVGEQTGNDSSAAAQLLSLPGAVDGRLESAAKLDWYKFDGKKGTSVTLHCRSRSLGGSVEPVVSFYGPSGRELAHSSGRRREPILTLTLPADGQYRVRVADRAYGRNEQSFYRLALLTGRRVVGCFPNVLQRGSTRDVTLFGFGLEDPYAGRLVGCNAPLSSVRFNVPLAVTGSHFVWQESVSPFPRFSLDLPSDTQGSAQVAYVDREVTIEDEAKTESLETPQAISLPVLLNGRFDRRGDIDWYSFSAKKDQTMRIELYGDRLGQQMDLDAVILDASGKNVITFPDAGTPKNVPAVLSMASQDISAVWKAPADGDYRLLVRDLFGGSLTGVDRSYILDVRESRPAFHVFAIPTANKRPAGLTVPKDGHTQWRLFAVRHNGFRGDIRITLAESEKHRGITLDECWIGPGETSTSAILTASAVANTGPQFLHLLAEAQLGDELVQSAVHVATTMNNGTVTGRLVGRAAILVGGKEPLGIELKNTTPVVVAGQKLKLNINRTRLVGILKTAAKIEFPVLPTGMKAPAAMLQPNDETASVELAIPKQLATGRYSVAVSVAVTILQPEETKKNATGQTSRIWSNSVVFEVK